MLRGILLTVTLATVMPQQCDDWWQGNGDTDENPTDTASDTGTDTATESENDTGTGITDTASETDSGLPPCIDDDSCDADNNEVCNVVSGLCVCGENFTDYGDDICREEEYISLQEGVSGATVTLLLPNQEEIADGISPQDIVMELMTDSAALEELNQIGTPALNAIISITPDIEELYEPVPIDIQIVLPDFDPENPPILIARHTLEEPWKYVPGSYSEEKNGIVHVRGELTHFSLVSTISPYTKIESLHLTDPPEKNGTMSFYLNVDTSYASTELWINGEIYEVTDGLNFIYDLPVGDPSTDGNIFTVYIISKDDIFAYPYYEFYVDDTEVPDNADALLEDFAPAFYLNAGEDRLPLPIEDIFKDEHEICLISNGKKEVLSGSQALDEMSVKGFGNSMLEDCKDSLWNYTQQAATTDNISIYGRAIKGPEGTNTVYLQYWTFYAFDPKTGDWFDRMGKHPLDRERFTLRLNCNENNTDCTIAAAYFAGHLETQTLGSDDERFSEEWEWEGGRVMVPGDKLRLHCGHPVLYVALGSHAIYPAPRKYYVKEYDYTEPALGTGVHLLPSSIITPNESDEFSYTLLTPDSDGFPNFKELTSLDPKDYWLFSGYWIGLPVLAHFPPFDLSFSNTNEWALNTPDVVFPDSAEIGCGNFVSVWKTDNIGDSEDIQISLPLVSNGEYDFVVNWGDGRESSISNWNDSAKTHTYDKIGTYEVRIRGIIKGWSTFPLDLLSYGEGDKLLKIRNWGPLSFGETSKQFYNCRNLLISAEDTPDLSETNSLEGAFAYCYSLDTIPSANEWDTSNVTDMSWMFVSGSLFNQDISLWNTSNVTNMTGMFREASSFDQNLSLWDVSNVADMSWMFARASSFDQNLSAWNISNVTTMEYMFDDITLSTANYDSLLMSWGYQDVQENVIFDGGNSKWTNISLEAVNRLVLEYYWTIHDGGPVQ